MPFLAIALLYSLVSEAPQFKVVTLSPAEIELRYGPRLDALRAAAAVYSIPDVKLMRDKDDIVEAYEEFLEKTPKDYELYRSALDLETGLKMAIYSPQYQGEPWILAIAGTQTLIDWVVNLNLGEKQFEALLHNVLRFSSVYFVDDQNRGLLERDLVITGHSLGGGLSQAIAYHIAKLRHSKGITSPIKLVTWNGFGGKELIERTDVYDEAIAKKVEITNYFVKGDPVARIGTHFGPTLQLIPPPRKQKYKVRPDGVIEDMEELVRLHNIATTQKIVEEAKEPLDILRFAEYTRPQALDTINGLVKFGGVFRRTTSALYQIRQPRLAVWLSDVLKEFEEDSFQSRAANEAYIFIENLTVSELFKLREQPERELDTEVLTNRMVLAGRKRAQALERIAQQKER